MLATANATETSRRLLEARVDEAGQPGQEVVERSASALAQDRPEHVREGPVAEEEDERLVLVRRQRVQAQQQERGEARGDRSDPEHVPVDGVAEALRARRRLWHSLVPSAGSPRARC